MTLTTRVGILAAVLLAALTGLGSGAELAAHHLNPALAAVLGLLAFAATATGGRHLVARADGTTR